MFLFGFFAGRAGAFRDPDRDRPILREVFFWGLVIGVAGNVCLPFLYRNGGGGLARFIHTFAAPALSACYASGIALLHEKEEWRRRFAPIAAVGRMGLTNYLFQSLCGLLLFSGFGLGLFGRIGPATGLLVTCAIYAIQIPLSVLWLRRFDFGPVDWVLRCITYGRLMPIRSTA